MPAIEVLSPKKMKSPPDPELAALVCRQVVMPLFGIEPELPSPRRSAAAEDELFSGVAPPHTIAGELRLSERLLRAVRHKKTLLKASLQRQQQRRCEVAKLREEIGEMDARIARAKTFLTQSGELEYTPEAERGSCIVPNEVPSATADRSGAPLLSSLAEETTSSTRRCPAADPPSPVADSAPTRSSPSGRNTAPGTAHCSASPDAAVEKTTTSSTKRPAANPPSNSTNDPSNSTNPERWSSREGGAPAQTNSPARAPQTQTGSQHPASTRFSPAASRLRLRRARQRRDALQHQCHALQKEWAVIAAENERLTQKTRALEEEREAEDREEAYYLTPDHVGKIEYEALKGEFELSLQEGISLAKEWKDRQVGGAHLSRRRSGRTSRYGAHRLAQRFSHK